MDNCLMRRYIIGEKRLIEWQIKPNSQLDTVVVTDATYEIIEYGKVIKSGSATVDANKISILFEADKAGSFTVKVFVTVPPETVEAELYIDVME